MALQFNLAIGKVDLNEIVYQIKRDWKFSNAPELEKILVNYL